MLITEHGKLVDRTTQIQRAGRFQGRHQHALVGSENLGGLAHELHAGHDQGLRRMILAEAGHFQRVTDNAAGFLGQVLHCVLGVVMGHQHRVFLYKAIPDLLHQELLAIFGQLSIVLVRQVVFDQLANFQKVFGSNAHNCKIGL